MPSTPALDFDGLRPPSPFFTDTHQAWRANLRRFVEAELAPHVDAFEEAGRLPPEIYLTAGRFGLLGAGFPEAYGGWSEGYDRFCGIVTAEELARLGAGGISAALMLHGVTLTWAPDLYGHDPDVVRLGSAWLLWGVGAALGMAWLRTRGARGAAA